MGQHNSGQSGAIADWILRRLLWLYPAEVRRRHGDELIEHSLDRYRRAREEGVGHATRWWLMEGLRFGWDGVGERTERLVGSGHLNHTHRRSTEHGSALASDLLAALRDTRRNWRFTGVLTLVLALALGAGAAVFSLLDAIVLRPLHYPEPDRLMAIWVKHDAESVDRVPLTQWDVIELERSGAFEAVGAFTQQRTALHLEQGSVEVGFGWLTRSTLDLLGVEPILGRAFNADDQGEMVVMLDHDFWQTRYGADPGVVGQTLRLAQQSWTIIGVLPPRTPLDLPALGRVPAPTDIWSFMWVENPDPDATSAWMRTVARLAEGVSVEQARDIVERVAADSRDRFPERATAGYGFDVSPLRQDFTAGVANQLWLVFWGSMVLLLAAAFNGGNLLILQHARRRKRLAIQRALGASERRLARIGGFEVGIVVLAAVTLALPVGSGILDALLRWIPADFPRTSNVQFSLRSVLFMGVAALPCLGLLALFLNLTSRAGGSVLSGRGSAQSGAGWGRAIVVLELGLATALIASGLLLTDAVLRLERADPGFNPSGAVALRLALPNAGLSLRDLGDMVHEVSGRVASLPGVTAAGASNVIPFDGNLWVGRVAVTRDLLGIGDGIEVDYRFVSTGFAEALGIRLIRGAMPVDGSPDESVYVDQALATLLWADADPLNRTLAASPLGRDSTFVVNAVVQNISKESPGVSERPTIYFTSRAYTLPYVTLIVRGRSDPEALLGEVRALALGVHPDFLVADATPLAELARAARALQSWMMRLVVVFAGIAALITALGMHAVVGQFVAARRGALGVRRALGASASHLGMLVAREVIVISCIGFPAGIALAAFTSRLLAASLPGGATATPALLAIVMLMVSALAILATIRPLFIAMTIEPVRVLREG